MELLARCDTQGFVRRYSSNMYFIKFGERSVKQNDLQKVEPPRTFRILAYTGILYDHFPKMYRLLKLFVKGSWGQ